MKRYLGVHINPSMLRSAVMVGDKPLLVPTKEGGLAYSTADVFTLSERRWICNEQRLTQLLTWVREDVERYAGAGEWEMVLTLPTAFGYGLEHRYLRPAARAAGMPVAYLLRESNAVALNYFWNGMGRGEEAFRAVVAMVSPKTIGVSVLEASDGIVEELAVTEKRGGVSPQFLQNRIEEALTIVEEEAPVERAAVTGSGIRVLLLNNEAVRKPEYRDVMGRLKRAGQKVYGYPDETAALGAALHGAKLGGDPRVQEPLMLATVPHDYYVMLADRRRVSILSRGTCCPVRKSILLTTAKDGQTDAQICIGEAESDTAEMELVLQQELKGLTPGKAGTRRIEVTLDMQANGTLQCTAREIKTGECPEALCAGALPPANRKEPADRSGMREASEPKENAAACGKEIPIPKKEEMVSLAEFENFRRRMTQEKDAMYDQGICNALRKFLPVIDNFERGLATLTLEQKATDAAVGMERIYRQMQKAMEELGVTPIEAVGKPFDLERHNAVMQADIPDVPENIVVEEFEKGYMYHDTVLRYSVVKVSK